MYCRKHIYDLTAAELTAFRSALQAVKANGTYDQFVRIHAEAMGNPTLAAPVGHPDRNPAHSGPAFGPWHRAFLLKIEQAMRAAVPGVVFPYWNWAQDAALASPQTAPLWTASYLGGPGAPAPGSQGDVIGSVVADGPVAGWTRVVLVNEGNPPTFATASGIRRNCGNPKPTVGGFGNTLPSEANVTAAKAQTDYDISPWDRSVQGFRNHLEGWVGSGLHNRVHMWIAGDMGPGTSPNDPVFYLHHCNIDRLWAEWQVDTGGTLVPPPPAGGPPGHKREDTMWPWAGEGLRMVDMEDHHALGYRYDTELTITPPASLAINFEDVPQGETTWRAASIGINNCKNVRFEIVNPPGVTGPFATPAGTSVDVNTEGADGFARIWLEWTAPAAPAGATGSVTVRASWIPPGRGSDEAFRVTLGQWAFTVAANSVPRPQVATALVLDQSGSMDLPAGTAGRTRVQVLREAAARFVQLVQPQNGIGIVRFDSVAILPPAMPVQKVITGGGGDPVIATASTAVAAHATNPLGSTSIGGGVIAARNMLTPLPVADYVHKAIVVFTDGYENTPPMIADVGPIDDRVFAVGLGSPEDIRPEALDALTTASGGAGGGRGYIYVTGPLGPTTDDYFLLSKYFLQILAGVTSTDIIVDPTGWISPGSIGRLPFVVTESDIDLTAALLVDRPVVDFVLETPDGATIDPGIAALTPGMQFSVGTNMSYYRASLPVVLAAGPAHAGQWHAVFKVDDRRFRSFVADLGNDKIELERRLAHGVRWSFTSQAYSNLRLRGEVLPAVQLPGGTLALRARLSEYGVPLPGVRVLAEIVRPDGLVVSRPLREVAEGRHEADEANAEPGIYRFRLLASGRARRGTVFTRELALTAAVRRGGQREPAGRGDDVERWCKLLDCLIGNGALKEFFARNGIDEARISDCVAKVCRQGLAAEDAARFPDLEAMLGREGVRALKVALARSGT